MSFNPFEILIPTFRDPETESALRVIVTKLALHQGHPGPHQVAEAAARDFATVVGSLARLDALLPAPPLWVP